MINLDISRIHKRFLNLRMQTGLSQRELSNMLGVAHSRISKLENEKDDTIPSLRDLLAYSNYYSVSIDYLLALDAKRTTKNMCDEIVAEINNLNDVLNSLKEKIELLC